MSSRLHSLAVAGVVAAGAGLIATAAGGVAGIDGQLAAATAPVRPVVQTELVTEHRRCLRPNREPTGGTDVRVVERDQL
jgi:hypothetical protein